MVEFYPKRKYFYFLADNLFVVYLESPKKVGDENFTMAGKSSTKLLANESNFVRYEFLCQQNIQLLWGHNFNFLLWARLTKYESPKWYLRIRLIARALWVSDTLSSRWSHRHLGKITPWPARDEVRRIWENSICITFLQGDDIYNVKNLVSYGWKSHNL